MPNAISGMSGAEIVEYITNYVGNVSQDFQNFVVGALPLSEFRYCKMHDWKFLYKQNLPLAVTSGTNEYSLDASTVGFPMQAEDVHSIYSTSSGVYLKKTSLETLRRMDVKQDGGNANSDLVMWAPSGDNKIIFYPNVFKDTLLRVDGKVTPSPLLTLTNYPTVPYKNQESFIKYLLAQCLERENDARADIMKQEAALLIRQDINDDMASNGSTADEPRIKHWREASLDGVGGDLEAQWISYIFR